MIRLFLGAVCIAFAPIFVKLIDVNPTAVGYYRCGIAGLILLPWAIFRYKSFLQGFSNPRSLLFAFLAGVAFAGDLFVWHKSIHIVGAGLATLFANTQVLYLAAFGILFGSEKSSVTFVASVVLGLLGVALIAVSGSNLSGDNYLVGVGLGVSTGVFYSTYIISLRYSEQIGGELGTWERICFVSLVSSAGLLGIAGFTNELVIPTMENFAWLTALAVVAQIAGWYLITTGLPRVPVSRAGLVILTQPVGAIILGYLLFDETMNLVQMAGAAITLSAVYFGAVRKREPVDS